MTDDTECIHEMNPEWCATCKQGPIRNVPEVVDYQYTAKYNGQCPECNLPISIG